MQEDGLYVEEYGPVHGAFGMLLGAKQTVGDPRCLRDFQVHQISTY